MTDKSLLLVKETLESVALQLGVAADKLWPVLIRQVQLEAYMGIAFTGFMVLVAVALVASAVWVQREIAAHRMDGRVVPHEVLTFITAVWCGFTLLIGALCTGDAVTGLLNPEYAALSKVLSLVKGAV
jgi:hypothetical protein